MNKNTGIALEEAPAAPTLADALDSLSPDFAPEPVTGEGTEEPDPTTDDIDEPSGDVEAEAEAEAPADEPPPEPEGEGEEAADEPEAEEEVEAEAPAAEDVVVLRAPGDDGPLEVEIEGLSEEQRAGLDALQERADSAAQMEQGLAAIEDQRAQVEQDVAQLDAIELEMRVDPTGFLRDRIKDETKVAVVLDLLHDEDVLGAVEARFEEWSRDPSKRSVAAAEAKAARVERKQELREHVATQAANRERAREVYRAVEGMIPSTMSTSDATSFREDAIADLTKYARENNGLEVDDIPEVLARRLRLYGIEAIERSTNGTGARTRATTQRTGERLKAQAAKRKRAAATAPSTTGHIPGRARPPKGASLDDALKWSEQNLQGV